MNTLTFTIIGKGKKTTTVQANIEGQIIKFFGVDKATYLKRMKSYQAPSRRHWLLSWLNKNNTHTDPPMRPVAPVKAEKTPLPQSIRPVTKAAPKSTPVVISIGDMVLEVERQLVAKGYTLVKKGNSIPVSICSHLTRDAKGKIIEHGCGKKSMVGAFKEQPDPKFIGVCFHRYDLSSSCEVVKVWGKENAQAWLAKQKAA